MKNNNRRYRGWGLLAVVAALIGGCGVIAPSPGVDGEWQKLLDDIRAFERRIGFDQLESFSEYAESQERHTFCGYSSRYELPYSYEDPAIRWVESASEEDCNRYAKAYDVYFGSVEALGESGAPVTPDMVTGKFDRFLYLIIHEDCHDEFDLPYGVEEALCNLIAFRAMPAFGAEKYWRFAGANRAIRRYADEQLKATRATIAYYEQIAALYARYGRKEITGEALLQERDEILRQAARPLAWRHGEPGIIRLATDMTYSRHYPLLESVHEALGRDLAKTVAFYKHVDRVKPSKALVLKRHRLRDEKGLAFIKAYEAAVVETIKAELPKYR